MSTITLYSKGDWQLTISSTPHGDGMYTISWKLLRSTGLATVTFSQEMPMDRSYRLIGALRTLESKYKENNNHALADIFRDLVTMSNNSETEDIKDFVQALSTYTKKTISLLRGQRIGEG